MKEIRYFDFSLFLYNKTYSKIVHVITHKNMLKNFQIASIKNNTRTLCQNMQFNFYYVK